MYLVVVEYNAEGVPSFQSPMITGLVAKSTGIYTVRECYCVTVKCYCVTVDVLPVTDWFGMHRDAIC